jgi:hypothetical protein
MAYKKTNEAYFGDSFNRSLAMNYCTADSVSTIDGLTAIGDRLVVDSDNCITLSCNNTTWDAATLKGISGEISICDSCVSTVDTMGDKLKALQAQIDDLKQNYVPKKGADKLRSALKTLNYTREI